MDRCSRCKLPLIKGIGFCPHCGARVTNPDTNKLQIPCKFCGQIIQKQAGQRQATCPRCHRVNNYNR